MIEAHELTKRYGDTIAVHSLSFTIAPGTVTGFLGPNGAGKSTTMRMIMGLDRPTSGTVTVNGKPYRQHRSPLREVGGLLEASAVHPGRSARSHLRTMAATHNIKASRVSEVIEMTGLAGVATKRVGGFSRGMGQRLGIAAALLGDPRTLILDEPVNGLDPTPSSPSAHTAPGNSTAPISAQIQLSRTQNKQVTASRHSRTRNREPTQVSQVGLHRSRRFPPAR
jgi:ABC-2 type transport system ATP-binding protein